MEILEMKEGLVEILTQKRMVAKLVLSYFGYAHQAEHLMSRMWRRTRLFLDEIKQNVPMFFESFKVDFKVTINLLELKLCLY